MCFFNKSVALMGSKRSLFVSENLAQVPPRKILQLQMPSWISSRCLVIKFLCSVLIVNRYIAACKESGVR